MGYSDERLDRAFALAHFILAERRSALEAAAEALARLEVAVAAQDRRLYYTPGGRARTRVSLGEEPLLQRLVYVACDPHERRREKDDPALREEDMLIHYVKHLVRIGLKRNSFYVTLGLSRLLRDCTTAQAMKLYSLVVQDPDRVKDDYYYRSGKARLLREVKERFGPAVTSERGPRGEERLRTVAEPRALAALAERCLERFTPWGSPCGVPARFDPLADELPALAFRGADPDEEHAVEVSRVHAVTHPACYGSLARALALPAPQERWAIPQFLMGHEGDDTRPRWRRDEPADLDEDERAAVRAVLEERSARRRGAAPALLRIDVDGEPAARLDVLRGGRVRFEVPEGAERIEVSAPAEDVLLATHLLGGTRPVSLVLEAGQEIRFSVSPLRDGEALRVEVTYRETRPLRAGRLALRRWWTRTADQARGPRLLKPAVAVALPAALVAAVALRTRPWASPPADEVPTAVQPTGSPTLEPRTPDTGEPPSTPPEAPVTPVARGPSPVAGRVRAPDSAAEAVPLARVRRIYLGSLNGGDPLARRFAEELRSALAASGRFAPSDDADSAEAAFKASLRSLPASGGAELTIRLVGADGETLWPLAGRGSGRYRGDPATLGRRVVDDLTLDARRLEARP